MSARMCVNCLRIRQQHVSLYKYWQESFGLFGIFLRKLQQYGNTSSLLFTQLFQLLAPGNPHCFNQFHLEQWHGFFFSFSDRHGAFPCTKFSWETFLAVNPTANMYLPRGLKEGVTIFSSSVFHPDTLCFIAVLSNSQMTPRKALGLLSTVIMEHVRNILKIKSCSFSEALNLILMLPSTSISAAYTWTKNIQKCFKCIL